MYLKLLLVAFFALYTILSSEYFTSGKSLYETLWSSILVVLESCHQTCMTYTSAECTVENS